MSGMLHGDLQIVPRMSDLAAILARRRKAQQEAEDNDEGFYSREDEPPARKEPASSLPRVKKPEPAPSKGGESSVPSGAARREDLANPSAAPTVAKSKLTSQASAGSEGERTDTKKNHGDAIQSSQGAGRISVHPWCQHSLPRSPICCKTFPFWSLIFAPYTALLEAGAPLKPSPPKPDAVAAKAGEKVYFSSRVIIDSIV